MTRLWPKDPETPVICPQWLWLVCFVPTLPYVHSQLLVHLLLLGKCKVAGSIPVRDTIPLWVTSEGHLPARRSFFIGSSVTFQVILHKDSMWKYKVHFRCSSQIWAAFCCPDVAHICTKHLLFLTFLKGHKPALLRQVIILMSMMPTVTGWSKLYLYGVCVSFIYLSTQTAFLLQASFTQAPLM